MELDKLKTLAYKNAKEHGFFEEELADISYVMLVVTELAEAVSAYQKGKRADVMRFRNAVKYYSNFEKMYETYIKDTLEDELADTVIRCLSQSGKEGTNLEALTKIEHYLMFDDDDTFIESIFYITESIICNWSYSQCIGNVINLCKHLDIDIEYFVKQKMKYNKTRPYKHGKTKAL